MCGSVLLQIQPNLFQYNGKDKGKVHPITGHKDPEGE